MKNLMKLFLMLLLVTPVVLTSCDDEDDNKHELVGTWKYTMEESGYTMTVEVTFNSDNTGTSVTKTTFMGETSTETSEFTWSVDGNKLTTTEDEETETVTYSISGNKLTITAEEDGETTEIVYTKV